MVLSSIINRTVAVLDAGIAGHVANAATASFLLGPDKLALMFAPEFCLIAIATTACLPLIYLKTRKPRAHLLALAVVLSASLLLVYQFNDAPSLSGYVLVGLCSVYAIVTLGCYRLVRSMTRQ